MSVYYRLQNKIPFFLNTFDPYIIKLGNLEFKFETTEIENIDQNQKN